MYNIKFIRINKEKFLSFEHANCYLEKESLLIREPFVKYAIEVSWENNISFRYNAFICGPKMSCSCSIQRSVNFYLMDNLNDWIENPFFNKEKKELFKIILNNCYLGESTFEEMELAKEKDREFRNDVIMKGKFFEWDARV